MFLTGRTFQTTYSSQDSSQSAQDVCPIPQQLVWWWRSRGTQCGNIWWQHSLFNTTLRALSSILYLQFHRGRLQTVEKSAMSSLNLQKYTQARREGKRKKGRDPPPKQDSDYQCPQDEQSAKTPGSTLQTLRDSISNKLLPARIQMGYPV